MLVKILSAWCLAQLLLMESLCVCVTQVWERFARRKDRLCERRSYPQKDAVLVSLHVKHVPKLQ